MYSLILSRHSYLPENTDINRHWIDVMTYLPVCSSVYSLCQFINAWKQCREWVRSKTGLQLTCDICCLSMLLTIEHSCQWLWHVYEYIESLLLFLRHLFVDWAELRWSQTMPYIIDVIATFNLRLMLLIDWWMIFCCSFHLLIIIGWRNCAHRFSVRFFLSVTIKR